MAGELLTSGTTPRWVAELSSPPVAKAAASSGITDPPGYQTSKKLSRTSKAARDATSRKGPSPEEMDTLKLKKAWEVALAPAKNLPMTGFMMYMTGNSLQIFSVMMVIMAFKTPISGLLATNQAFERFETDTNRDKMILIKLSYFAMQLLALALGVWKVNAMGLLPTTRSDWLAWEGMREPIEFAVSGI